MLFKKKITALKCEECQRITWGLENCQQQMLLGAKKSKILYKCPRCKTILHEQYQ